MDDLEVTGTAIISDVPLQPTPLARSFNGSELPSLVNWGLPWVLAQITLAGLIGIQATYASAVQYFSPHPTESLIWSLAKGMAAFAMAFSLFSVYQSSKKFVHKEAEGELAEAMGALNVSWVMLGLLAAISVLNELSYCGDGVFPLAVSLTPRHGLAGAVSAIILVGGARILAFRVEQRCPSAAAFLKNLNPFAARSLRQIHFLSTVALAGGCLLLFVGAADLLMEVSPRWLAIMVQGFALFILGCSAQWYRRAVRLIHRNPTPVFLERSLNRLNLYWLLAVVSLLMAFLSGLL